MWILWELQEITTKLHTYLESLAKGKLYGIGTQHTFVLRLASADNAPFLWADA